MAGMPSLVTYPLPSETLQTPTGDKSVESFSKEEKDVLKMSFSLKRTRRKGKSIEGEVFGGSLGSSLGKGAVKSCF